MMDETWQFIPLGQVLTEIDRREVVEPDKTYRILGARWYAGGLYVKDVKRGAEIQAKEIFLVQRNDFVYNRLFAWKGSFAIATDVSHGCFVSNEFPCFKIDIERLDGMYLWRYFSRPAVWNEALGLSTGGTPTSRNRLKEERFLKIRIPLPPLKEQHCIVERIGRVDALRTLQMEVAAELDELYSAVLDKAFRGEL